MDEATFVSPPSPKARKGLLPLLRRLARHHRSPLNNQRGQAIVEYILVLILSLGFTRFVFFNKEFGFQAMLEKTMLRFGSFLEQNLKSGTRVGADGVNSPEPYGGTGRWSN